MYLFAYCLLLAFASFRLYRGKVDKVFVKPSFNLDRVKKLIRTENKNI